LTFCLGNLYTGHQHNLTNYNNAFNSNINPQFRQNPNMPNPIYNSYLQQQPPYVPIGPNGDIGILVSIIDRNQRNLIPCINSFSVRLLTMHLYYNHVQ